MVAGDRFTGWVANVPWGRDAAQLLATIATGDGEPLMLLLPGAGVVSHGSSPAGEPRDRLDYRDAPARVLGTGRPQSVRRLVRVAQTAGALEAALALAVGHVNTRVQFGKPLSRLQAVQQALAILAAEAAATTMAGAAAADALDRGGSNGAFEVMAARLRANMAIHRGVGIAHQVHGAIGFTRDDPLHPLTRRLIGWRSDFGGDRWAERLGALALLEGGAGLWTALTRLGDG